MLGCSMTASEQQEAVEVNGGVARLVSYVGPDYAAGRSAPHPLAPAGTCPAGP